MKSPVGKVDYDVIELLVVLEPSRRKLEKDMKTYTDWAVRNLCQEDVNEMLRNPQLKNFIHKDHPDQSTRHGMTRVRIFETLYMTYRWNQDNENLRVTHMSFEVFSTILKGGAAAIDRLVAQFDAFYGGVDFAVNVREFIDHFTSDHDLDKFILSMRYVAEQMPVWPPIREILRSRFKYDVIKALDRIAEKTTKTPRPRTWLLSEDLSLDIAGRSGGNYVLKREGSDCSNHVLTPDQIRKLSPFELIKMAEEKPFRWLLQDYVPALKYVGEWRVLIVGGRILYVVNTVVNDEGHICSDLRIAGYTLDEMQKRMETIPNYIEDDILERIGGSLDQRHHADAELHAFCLTTLHALVKEEGFEDSSLNMICRLDISIIETSCGRLHYFVNEVERGVAICLFSSVDTDHVTERVADEMGPLLVTWIRRRAKCIVSAKWGDVEPM